MQVYLDHAATTPLRTEARDAWIEASTTVGNASSIHGGGQSARRLLEESRERIAAVLDCDPIELVLTSGGTESINLALKGLWWSRRRRATPSCCPTASTTPRSTRSSGCAHTSGRGSLGVRLDASGRIDPAAFARCAGDAAASRSARR